MGFGKEFSFPSCSKQNHMPALPNVSEVLSHVAMKRGENEVPCRGIDFIFLESPLQDVAAQILILNNAFQLIVHVIGVDGYVLLVQGWSVKRNVFQ